MKKRLGSHSSIPVLALQKGKNLNLIPTVGYSTTTPSKISKIFKIEPLLEGPNIPVFTNKMAEDMIPGDKRLVPIFLRGELLVALGYKHHIKNNKISKYIYKAAELYPNVGDAMDTVFQLLKTRMHHLLLQYHGKIDLMSVYRTDVHQHLLRTASTVLTVLDKNPSVFKFEITEKDKTTLFLAALYHDIGKFFLDPEILFKKEKLTKEDKKYIDLHAKLGAEILKKAGFPKDVVYLVQHHHDKEFIAYPWKTKIVKLSELLNTADAFDAATHLRVYKDPVSKHYFLNTLKNKTMAAMFSVL